MFEQEFIGKNKMTFHQVAYAKDNGTMKFYYDKRDLTKCYSLLPLPQFGEEPAYIEVQTKNLKTMMSSYMPQVDIIKADIEGVWYDFCREILDNDINLEAERVLIFVIMKKSVEKFSINIVRGHRNPRWG